MTAPVDQTVRPRRVLRHVGAFALSLLLSGVILAVLWFWKGVRLDAVVRQWRGADHVLLAAVLVLSTLFHVFVGAHKLWCVLRAMGLEIPYREALAVRLGAGPLRILVPLSAGEFLNVFYFWRHRRMAFGRASGASVFDRGLNILGALFWLLAGLAVLPEAWPDAWPRTWTVPGLGLALPIKGTLFALVLGGYLLFFFCTPAHGWAVRVARRVHPKAGRLAEGVLAPLREFPLRTKLFFTAYAVVFQVRPLVVCYALLRAYGAPVDLVHVIAYMSVAVLAAHLPGFAVGMGPRETAMATLFAPYASADTLLSVGLLQTFMVHVIPIFVGLPWMWWFLKRLVRREPEAPGENREG